MRIVEKRVINSTANGEYVAQIEDWSEDYPALHAKSDMLVTYPVSKGSVYHEYHTYPQRGKTFRLAMQFPNFGKAVKALQALEDGTAQLKDYATRFELSPNVSRKQILQCI